MSKDEAVLLTYAEKFLLLALLDEIPAERIKLFNTPDTVRFKNLLLKLRALRCTE